MKLGMKIGDLSGKVERAEIGRFETLLQEWNATTTAYPKDATVHGLFVEQAGRTPDRTAVRYGEAVLRYGELDRKSNQAAHYLTGLELPRESFVAVLLDRSLDVAPALLGILKAGAAYLPIDTGTPVERAAYQLNEARARVLFSAAAHLPLLRALRQHCPELQIVCLDAHGEPLEDGMASASVIASRPVEALPERVGARDLAYLIYTSGTSGRPKGVMVEHRSIVRLVRDTNYIRIQEDDRILQTGSLAFDASTFEIWGALLNGAAVCFPDTAELLNAGEFEKLLRRDGITTLFLTTSLFNLYSGLNPEMFQGLRTLLTGGEKVSVLHMNKVRTHCPGLRLLHVYGPTENTTFTTFFPVDAPCEGDVPIGRPISNTTVHILDENLRPVRIGVQGELYAGGDGLARGYLNDNELTAAKFVSDPRHPGERLYRTGDLARWLPDGSVQFVARSDLQIKVRGFRIEPAEIEQQIRLHPGVQDVAVVGKSRAGESLELCAYLVAGESLDIDGLRRALKEHLPDYMVPVHFVRLEQFPLNANGKIDRAALPEPWTMTASADETTDGPASDTEEALLELWRQVLGRQDIKVTDDFFDLGGHSLRATKLASLIQKRLGIEMPLTAVFKYSTIRLLARFLVDSARFGVIIADEPMVLMNRVATSRPLFMFPPGTGDALSFAQFAEVLDSFDLYAFNFIEAESRISDYANLIVQTDPEGPYRLAGYSGGGNLAYYVARELENRGKRIADLVMFDSGRHLARVDYSPEAARKLATDFMEDEAVRPYIASVVLKEKVIRRIQGYYAFFSTLVDSHTVDCPIRLIYSEDSEDEYRDDSENVLVSKLRWAELTRGGFERHPGHGGHNQMFYEPFVTPNAHLLTRLLTET